MCALFRATYARGGQGLAPGQVSAPGQGLVSVDDCGKMIEALVLQILTAWQMCGKSVRNQWFTVAVAAITSRSGLVNAVGEGEGAGKGAAAAATSFGLQGLGNMSATAKAGHGLVVGTGIALGGVQGLGQPVVPYSAQGLGQGLFSTYPPTSLWPGMTLPGGGFTGSSSYGAGSGGSHGGGGAGKDRSTARKAHSTEGGATGGGRSRGAGGGGRSKGSASGGASTKIGGSVGGRAAASSKSRGAGSAQLPCLQEEDEIVAIAEDRGAQIWDTASGGTAAAAAVSAAKNDHNSAAMMVTADSDSERGVSPSPAHSVDEGGSVGAESGEGTLSVERVRTKVNQCNLGKRRRGAANVNEEQRQGQEKEPQVKMSAAALSSSSSSSLGVQQPLPQQHHCIPPPPTFTQASGHGMSTASISAPPATSRVMPTQWAGAGQSQASVRVMCFERVDTREWEIRDCRVVVADVIGSHQYQTLPSSNAISITVSSYPCPYGSLTILS